MADDMRERMWDAVEEASSRVRDAYPRRHDDAPSSEIADAVDTALSPILAERDRETARKAVEEHEARQIHITYERPMVREVPVLMPCPRCGAR